MCGYFLHYFLEHYDLTFQLRSVSDNTSPRSRMPKNPKNESKVRTQLSEQLGKKASLALQYVCLDLDLVPEGKFDKKKLVNRLVKWVRAGILST